MRIIESIHLDSKKSVQTQFPSRIFASDTEACYGRDAAVGRAGLSASCDTAR